jgi:Ca2+-binding RTX toxin-like protein
MGDPSFELLEARALRAAGASVTDGVLLIEGTFKGDRVALFRDDAGAMIFAKVNGVTQLFAAADVTKIVIDTKRGDDVVEILGGVIERPITVWTHAGNDTIVGGDGPERLNAGDDDDIVTGGGGRDTIYGGPGPGADILRGNGGSDLIDGEDGPDTVRGDEGNDNISGGDGIDRLRGSDGNDQLRGGASKDFIAGEAGMDAIWGDGGNDFLSGGDGTDRIDAGAGDDLLTGDGGADSMMGGTGNDVLYGTGDQADKEIDLFYPDFPPEGQSLPFSATSSSATKTIWLLNGELHGV